MAVKKLTEQMKAEAVMLIRKNSRMEEGFLVYAPEWDDQRVLEELELDKEGFYTIFRRWRVDAIGKIKREGQEDEPSRLLIAKVQRLENRIRSLEDKLDYIAASTRRLESEWNLEPMSAQEFQYTNNEEEDEYKTVNEVLLEFCNGEPKTILQCEEALEKAGKAGTGAGSALSKLAEREKMTKIEYGSRSQFGKRRVMYQTVRRE